MRVGTGGVLCLGVRFIGAVLSAAPLPMSSKLALTSMDDEALLVAVSNFTPYGDSFDYAPCCITCSIWSARVRDV